jgi:hypothetical protein
MKKQDGPFVVDVEELPNPTDGEDERAALEASATAEAFEVISSADSR